MNCCLFPGPLCWSLYWLLKWFCISRSLSYFSLILLSNSFCLISSACLLLYLSLSSCFLLSSSIFLRDFSYLNLISYCILFSSSNFSLWAYCSFLFCSATSSSAFFLILSIYYCYFLFCYSFFLNSYSCIFLNFSNCSCFSFSACNFLAYSCLLSSCSSNLFF